MSTFIRSPIKSIQRGTSSAACSATQNITIASVNTGKAMLNILGQRFDSAGVGTAELIFTAQLTSATNIMISPSVGASGVITRTVSWELIEYY